MLYCNQILGKIFDVTVSKESADIGEESADHQLVRRKNKIREVEKGMRSPVIM